MLRSRKKDVNIKPNRKLDKRSSRGMLYENEELRLRTIEINAEVERGQCDLKKLRRENQRLRRDIWSLREEYERLESEMTKMREGVGIEDNPSSVPRRRRRRRYSEADREEGEENGDEEDDEGEEDDEDEDFEGDEDEDEEEDEEEENAENLQKVNYYNNGGRLDVVEEATSVKELEDEKVMMRAAADDEGGEGRERGECNACVKKSSPTPEDSALPGNGLAMVYPSGGNLDMLVREVTTNGIPGQKERVVDGAEGGVVAIPPAGGSDESETKSKVDGAEERGEDVIAPVSPLKGCRKWLGNKLNFSSAAAIASQDSSQTSTPSSSTSAIPTPIPSAPSCPLHLPPPAPHPAPAPPNTALLDASVTLTPELTMRDVFASLANRIDAVVGVRLLSAPGAAPTLVLISLRSAQDLEALLRTGLEIRGHLFTLSDAASAHLPACDPGTTPQNLQNGVVNSRVCKESELGAVKEEDEGVEESGRANGVEATLPLQRLSASINAIPRTRSPSPALQRQPQHSLSLPGTPLPSAAGTASPKFPPRLGMDKQFGHCRSASADAGNDSSSKQKACVNFEDTCVGGSGGKGPAKKKNGILRRNVSQGEEEVEGGHPSCNHHSKPCRIHIQRSFSLDPRGSFHRRKGVSDRSGRPCEDGGSGMEADSENSRRGGSISSRASSVGLIGGTGKVKGVGRIRPTGDAPGKESKLPWCGCWGNGCF